MNIIRKKIIVILPLFISLVTVCSCASGVSQEQYDEVNDALTTAQSQSESLTNRLEELEAGNEELSQKNDALADELEGVKSDNAELSAQNNSMMSQIQELQDENEVLLSAQNAITEETTEAAKEISEEDVEQAIFELINTDRKNNGLDELMWGENLYKTAISNSKTMVTEKRIEESAHASYQEAIWATGYDSGESMAEAVFLIWQNRYKYEFEFLNVITTHGAVGVYKSGEIYYITYIAGIWS